MQSIFKRAAVTAALGLASLSAQSAAVVSVLGYGLGPTGYGPSASNFAGNGTASVDPAPFSVPSGQGFPGSYPAIYDGMASANGNTGTLRALAQATSLQNGTPWRWVESKAVLTGQVVFSSTVPGANWTTFAFDVDGTLSGSAYADVTLRVRRQGDASFTVRTASLMQQGAFMTALTLDYLATDGDVFDLQYELKTTALANYLTGSGTALADLSNSGHVRFGLMNGTSLSGIDGFLQTALNPGGVQPVSAPGTLALGVLALALLAYRHRNIKPMAVGA